MVQIPETIATAARTRIRQQTTQREQVLEAVREGRPLEAEPDRGRKVSRFADAAHVDLATAEELASGVSATELRLKGDARLSAERIQGKTADFVGVAFLDLARAAAAAVGRVVTTGLAPVGTGFLISDTLFVTNHHVIGSAEDAAGMQVQFNYEKDYDGGSRPSTIFRFAPEICFYTSAVDDLDFTVIAVGERVSGSARLSDFGYCPLSDKGSKHILGECVNVVQHPQGDYKQVVIRENRIVSRLDNVLHYLADTEPGSSGSPVFNDQFEAVALHHWGEPYTQTTDRGRKINRDVNEGIRMSAIVRELQDNRNQWQGTKRELLEAALKIDITVPRNALRHESAPQSAAPREPDSGAIVIPLEITIRAAVAGAGAGTATATATAVTGPVVSTVTPAGEAVRIDTRYSNRHGYDPDFLGEPLPLPKLNKTALRTAAKRLNAEPGDANPYELKYEHFSVVMNGKDDRRMPYFTAVNIDGATWINIDRDTGEPKPESMAEAAEVWYQDPRIAPDDQGDPSIYASQRPRHVFDRGHMVRRQDPCWGTNATAKRANADTFHFTNCCPQVAEFNQKARYWQGIENYILDNAKEEEKQVTVFTGPVFGKKDPEYRGIRVPLQFFKILVRVESGQMLATALLASQAPVLKTLPESLEEAFDELGRVKEYQTSVEHVEKLTGLDFGNLRNCDTHGSGESLRPLGMNDAVRLEKSATAIG